MLKEVHLLSIHIPLRNAFDSAVLLSIPDNSLTGDVVVIGVENRNLSIMSQDGWKRLRCFVREI